MFFFFLLERYSMRILLLSIQFYLDIGLWSTLTMPTGCFANRLSHFLPMLRPLYLQEIRVKLNSFLSYLIFYFCNVFCSNKIELNPEFCPKWNYLLELLRVEIPQEIKKAKNKDNKILILCSDNKTCYQLNQVLKFIKYTFLYLEIIQ